MKHSERKHSLLSPSGAKRWMTCTPSARLGEKCPKRETAESKEGTLAHEWCAFNLAPEQGFKEGKVSDEMKDYCKGYIEYVLKTAGFDDLYVEQPLDLTRYIPEGKGIADALIVGDDYIHVIDFKYGAGVKVDAVFNPQIMCYALGALELYPKEQVWMTIYQPRMDNVSKFFMTAEKLKEWADEQLVPAAQKAFEGVGEYVTGDHCQFCPAKDLCRQRAVNALVLKGKTSGLMTDREIEQYLPYLDDIEKVCEELKEYAVQQAVMGKTWKGMELTQTPARRQWQDKASAAKKLFDMGKQDLLKVEPVTISAVEKELGKDAFNSEFAEFVGMTQSKPTLKRKK